MRGEKCHIKTIGVFLPVSYRGGTLNGAKNIAKMLHLGSRQANEPITIIFSCIDNTYDIAKEFSDLLALGIEVRETRWKIIPDITRKHSEYAIPCFGTSSFEDCDFWLIISDRLKRPLAPIKPYGIVIYDYIQRYVPQIFNDSFSDFNFIATARQAKFMLTTTPGTRDDAIQYAGISPKKVFLSPMEFDTYDYQGNASKINQDFFLWPSNATEHKNHLNAIEALNIYYQKYDGKLAVMMTGQNTDYFINHRRNASLSPYSKEVMNLIEKSPVVKANLTICGNITLEKYIGTLQSATFLWHPTLIDNGTYAVVEAAFHGIPSLSSDYPQMHFMNERFNLGLTFCQATNPDDMAMQLKQMEMNHIKKREFLPKKEFLEKFSYKNISPEFWNLVRGLI